MWNSLTDEATLRALGAIGGVISFLWGVGWAIYQFIQQSKDKAAEKIRAKGYGGQTAAPERRPVRLLAMLGTVLAIWASVLFMAGATWWLWKTYIIEKKPIMSHVCRAENGDRCPPGAEVVGCGDAGPVIEDVRKSCGNLAVRKVMDSAGGRCGHTVWELTCLPK